MTYRFEIDYRDGHYEVFQLDPAGCLIGFTACTPAEWAAFIEIIDGPAEIVVNCLPHN